MENSEVRHLLAVPVIVIVVTVYANHCTEPVPAWSLYQSEVSQRRLVREEQDAANSAVLQAKRVYEWMSDKEQVKGVVYEN